jgi:transposase InsO family protein
VQADLILRIKQIAETRVRYGYRRIHVLLRREGRHVNAKRVYRLYKELGLQLRHKPPKRRVKVKLREDRIDAARPNDTWAMDFAHHQLATGKKLRVLTVVDIFSKFSPVVDPRFNYRGEDVVQTLERVCKKTGYPILHAHIREKPSCLVRPTAHRKSLRFVKQTESHHKAKIEVLFSSLLICQILTGILPRVVQHILHCFFHGPHRKPIQRFPGL